MSGGRRTVFGWSSDGHYCCWATRHLRKCPHPKSHEKVNSQVSNFNWPGLGRSGTADGHPMSLNICFHIKIRIFKFQISIGQGWGVAVPSRPSEPSRPSPGQLKFEICVRTIDRPIDRLNDRSIDDRQSTNRFFLPQRVIACQANC